MGMRTEINEEGKYKLTSTITDGDLHEKDYVSEAEAKRILIHSAMWDFMEKVIKISMDFPNQYSCDGVLHRVEEKILFNKWYSGVLKSDNYEKKMSDKFEEICKTLDIGFELKGKVKSDDELEFIENVGADNATVVTLESAKKLKEDGFDLPTHYYYLDQEILRIEKGLKRVKAGKRRMNHNKYDSFIYSAPTKEELKKWNTKKK